MASHYKKQDLKCNSIKANPHHLVQLCMIVWFVDSGIKLAKLNV